MTEAKCLCGRVSLSVRVTSNAIHACHCLQCQRWTGGGPLFVTAVEDVEIRGDEHLGTYHASEHGERGFCRVCGTTLYWAMRGKAPSSVPVGLLDDQSGLVVKEEIFIDYRPAWLGAFPDAAQSTEAEQLCLLAEYLQRAET